MSLVNVSLKLWSLNMAYMLIFLLKNVSSNCICKSYSHFFSKNTCELDSLLTRTVNILTTNDLVKLTMLWTLDPGVEVMYPIYHKYSDTLTSIHTYPETLNSEQADWTIWWCIQKVLVEWQAVQTLIKPWFAMFAQMSIDGKYNKIL